MNILELSKKSLFILLLSLMALVMLPGCSSTEEESSSTEENCNCAEGDLQCQEACLQDLPI